MKLIIFFLDAAQCYSIGFLIESHASGILSFSQMTAKTVLGIAMFAANVVVFRHKVPWRQRLAVFGGLIGLLALLLLEKNIFWSETAWLPLLAILGAAVGTHVMATLNENK